jgi:hypothetical protein
MSRPLFYWVEGVKKEVCADVAELVYATDLKSVARKGLRVQLPPSAPFEVGLPEAEKLIRWISFKRRMPRQGPSLASASFGWTRSSKNAADDARKGWS